MSDEILQPPPYAAYDPRRNPQRDVRVIPLPRFMHRRFQAFIAEYRALARSHLGTWKLAKREGCEYESVHAHIVYWNAIVKALNHMEYLGTANDPRKRSRFTRHIDR